MASLNDRWSRRWGSHIAEKFVPPSSWAQDAEGNDLLDIYLPGFKPEEVRIELASADDLLLKIEGERIVNENKCIYIDHTFSLPKNCDIENVVGRFEGERLQITVPKILVEEENKQEDSEFGNGNGNEITADEEESMNNHDNQRKGSNETCRVGTFREETIKKWEEKENPLGIAIKCVKRNKGIIVSVIISFSIGVWIGMIMGWVRSEIKQYHLRPTRDQGGVINERYRCGSGTESLLMFLLFK